MGNTEMEARAYNAQEKTEFRPGDSQDLRTILPMGVTLLGQGIHVNVVSPGKSCAIRFCLRNEEEPFLVKEFLPEERMGDVWSSDISYQELKETAGKKAAEAAGRELTEEEVREELLAAEYDFACERGLFEDPYGHSFSGRDSWGKAEQYGNPLRSPLFLKPFDWEGDKPLRTPLEDTIIYRLHVRGFTKSPSSGVVQKGTFDGIVEKIPYLKELGITAVELMPCQEYEELTATRLDYTGPVAAHAGDGAAKTGKGGAKKWKNVSTEGTRPTGKINYWGYTKAHHFAPKASLCRKKDRDPAGEFRTLVRELHKAGIEVITELFFDGSEDASYVAEVLRYYVRFFHVDGIRLTGYADAAAASRDPYLAGVKLIAGSWREEPRKDSRRLASCGDAFQRDMRRFLKGDEGMLNSVIYHSRNNPPHAAVINYMANTNGFTLADTVMYDIRHNEANGEGNSDGPEENFSWNCGVEGPSKKKKIRTLRKQQLRNAFLLLLLSQGTPLILAGDEFGRTQGGNNNAWCQDNAISWVNWKLLKTEAWLFEFVKKSIAFRQQHRAFHGTEQPKLMDPRATGIPDVSYHGVMAWRPEFELWRRQLGILYNGAYAPDESGKPDSTFFVMYNMHWEEHVFALPHPDRGAVWHLAANTADDTLNGWYPAGEEPLLEDQRGFVMAPRSIVVLMTKTAPKPAPKKRKKKENAAEKETEK